MTKQQLRALRVDFPFCPRRLGLRGEAYDT
jgi:hypothetical protein